MSTPESAPTEAPPGEAAHIGSEPDYRVALQNFAGPLDLLLHLVKKEEIDIHDIPITRILQQYLAHLEVMQHLDLDAAGDFMVMAATLMVIKSRMLLPAEEVDLEEEIDPRYELVQQLLEYKKLKDSSRILLDRAALQAQRVGRPDEARPDTIKVADRSIEEVGLFDILEAFSKIMESIGLDAGKKVRRVKVDDQPVRYYVATLGKTLRKKRSLLFTDLFDKDADRGELVGYFLALLLLLKQEVVSCAQDGGFGDIRILYRGSSDDQALQLELDDDFK